MFSVFFCVFFFGSLRVGPDSHKGPVAPDLRAPDPVLNGMKYLVKLARDHIATSQPKLYVACCAVFIFLDTNFCIALHQLFCIELAPDMGILKPVAP